MGWNVWRVKSCHGMLWLVEAGSERTGPVWKVRTRPGKDASGSSGNEMWRGILSPRPFAGVLE